MSEWQLIKTAPTDGTPVDLWIVSCAGGHDADSVDFYTDGLAKYNNKTRRREGRACNKRYEKRAGGEGWYTVGGLSTMALTVEATHWMPLPAPPEKDTQ